MIGFSNKSLLCRNVGIVFALVAGLAFASNARANIMLDFESLSGASALAGAGSTFISDTHSEGGFTLASSAFASWGASSNNYAGSTALFAMFDSDMTTLSRNGGGAFSFDSIDLGEAFSSGGTASVTFTGQRADGSTVANMVDLDGQFGFETFGFTGFNNLVSLSWSQGTIYTQFDNILLRSPAVVPVPGSVVLGAIGLGIVGLVRRRRR